MLNHLKKLSYKIVLLSMVIGLLGFTIALAASGGLDTTFDGDGRVMVDFAGRSDVAYDMAIQSNGRIVAAGYSFASSTSNYDFFLTRHNTNGSLDTTFSGDGGVITNFGGRDEAYSVAVQTDGKIIATGQTCDLNGNNCNLALARYNSNGTLDTTFSGDGKQITDFGGSNNGSHGGLAIQSNDKIVVAGWMWNGTDYDFAVYRYNKNGTLDTTFSGDGRVRVGFGTGRWDQGERLDIQDNDGKIVIIGFSGDASGNNNNFAIARLNANGSLDTTFSGDGRQTTDFGGNDKAWGFAGQTDGKMVVVGQKVTSTEYFALARYNPNGALDTTFNGTGKKVFSIVAGAGSYAFDALVQSDDSKIVVLGAANNNFALVRLNSNGGLDNTFSGDGKVTIDFCSSNDGGYALALQSNGRYVLGGTTDCAGGSDFGLARVLP